MKRILSMLFLLVCLTVLSYAQTGLVFQASLTGVNYNSTAGPNQHYPFGHNACMTLYPTQGVYFPATASSNCPGTTASCNGLYVSYINTYGDTGTCRLLYVSPGQINIVTPPN